MRTELQRIKAAIFAQIGR
jgi:hypothetical protein